MIGPEPLGRFNDRETALALFVASVEASRAGADEIRIPHLVLGLLRTNSVRELLQSQAIDVEQVIATNGGSAASDEVAWLCDGVFTAPPEEDVDRELDALLETTAWRTSVAQSAPLLPTAEEVRTVLSTAATRTAAGDAIRPLDLLELIVETAAGLSSGLEVLRNYDFRRHARRRRNAT